MNAAIGILGVDARGMVAEDPFHSFFFFFSNRWVGYLMNEDHEKMRV